MRPMAADRLRTRPLRSAARLLRRSTVRAALCTGRTRMRFNGKAGMTARTSPSRVMDRARREWRPMPAAVPAALPQRQHWTRK
jgi:hypothetical protein